VERVTCQAKFTLYAKACYVSKKKNRCDSSGRQRTVVNLTTSQKDTHEAVG